METARKQRYTETMSKRTHSADMESIRKHDLSIEDRTEKQKALMPEANLACLKERCWCYGTHCRKNREMCNAYF